MEAKLCYFNQHWNIYLYTGNGYESWCHDETLETKRSEEKNHHGEYRLRKYEHPEIPIYSFGFFADDESRRPGHGGEWSSNAKHINTIFGTELIEVALDQISVAVPLPWLKELLGDNVVWTGGDNICVNEIISVPTHPNPKYCEWIIIPTKDSKIGLKLDYIETN
jgi:hypothetical protein